MNSDQPTWIFLRGLTRESRHWGSFIVQFEQALPHNRVIALDLPGNGLLNQQPSPWRVQDMVEDCRAQLQARNLAPPYRLLAMSLGAMVAVAWAHAHPAEVAAQVLINTSLRPFSVFYQRLKPRNYVTLLKLTLRDTAPEVWEHTILRMTSNQATADAVPLWLALRQANPVSRTNVLRQLVAATRFRAAPGRPGTATLLLASEQDHLVSVQCSKTLRRHWQCDLHIHATAGHDLALDDGLWVAAQVREWLYP
jgi:pimeloyl-ACP methyl ester carboxylesterase